jgi:hypothetical protein
MSSSSSRRPNITSGAVPREPPLAATLPNRPELADKRSSGTLAVGSNI